MATRPPSRSHGPKRRWAREGWRAGSPHRRERPRRDRRRAARRRLAPRLADSWRRPLRGSQNHSRRRTRSHRQERACAEDGGPDAPRDRRRRSAGARRSGRERRGIGHGASALRRRRERRLGEPWRSSGDASCEPWAPLWLAGRLRLRASRDRKRLERGLAAFLGRRVEALAADLANRLPARPAPALLHGDLWSGNILAAGGRVEGLIDPACYYGHAEVDLAMLGLFDAPAPAFFAAYGPLDHGHGERRRFIASGRRSFTCGFSARAIGRWSSDCCCQSGLERRNFKRAWQDEALFGR
ncbi:fructosamine kinase family protein [Methylocapsa acidiphila]|uniref:fructosamine kinase family protein n=1 Tax=Methylocapsa acidiphila TaxID=133552 RepID=UPI003CC90BC6